MLNGFAQDEITLISNRLWFTAGSKFELDQFPRLDVQPSVRLRWQPHARHTFWAAVSRALRTPSEYEESARITNQVFPGPQGIPGAVTLFGNDNLKPGSLLAYELGYRAQLNHQVSLDWAAFYNISHGITGEVSQQPFIETNPLPLHLVIPLQFANNVGVHSYGMEISSSYTPVSYWKFVGSYSWLYMDEHPAAVLTQFKPGNNPEHQFQAHSNLTFRRNFELDNGLSYVGALAGQPVPNYLRLDSRVGWHPGEQLEFSVVGQNLLRPRHPEFLMPNDNQGYAQVGRSVYGKVTWHF